MARQITERRFALREASLRVAAAEQRLRPRLMRVGVELKQLRAGACDDIVIDQIAQARPLVGPTGDDRRQRLHIRLRVAAVHAERMQLQHFAGEVLVDARWSAAARQAPSASRVLASGAVGPDRQPVVEIDDHARMLGRCEQHVGKATSNVRPDRFLLERWRQCHCAGFGGRDGEMVGPEMHQPFVHRRLRRQRGFHARCDCARDAEAEVLHEVFLNRKPLQLFLRDALAFRAFFDARAVAVVQAPPRQPAAKREQIVFGRWQCGDRCRRLSLAADLPLHPAARVVRDNAQFTGARAEAEAMRGEGGEREIGHGRSS